MSERPDISGASLSTITVIHSMESKVLLSDKSLASSLIKYVPSGTLFVFQSNDALTSWSELYTVPGPATLVPKEFVITNQYLYRFRSSIVPDTVTVPCTRSLSSCEVISTIGAIVSIVIFLGVDHSPIFPTLSIPLTCHQNATLSFVTVLELVYLVVLYAKSHSSREGSFQQLLYS